MADDADAVELAVASSPDEFEGPPQSEHRSLLTAATASDAPDDPAGLTWRGVLGGLAVGVALCFSNMRWGLESGWVTMGSLQSALIGFLMLKMAHGAGLTAAPLGRRENVLLQTVAVATATLPLSAGFVGIIPALALLPADEGGPVELGTGELLLWSAALAFFGVFFAVPMRRQTILREKLPFPSGTATGKMIDVLHSSADAATRAAQWRCLKASFAASGLYTGLAHFVPVLHNLPVLGLSAAVVNWRWVLTPSLSYFGQGMVMGPRSACSMLVGAVVGWAIVGPAAEAAGWASNPSASDWATSSWLVWLGLAVMTTESLTSLALLALRPKQPPQPDGEAAADDDPAAADDDDDIPASWWGGGLAVSTVLLVPTMAALFDMPAYEPFVAMLVAAAVALLAVRALGETDLNPVSSLGKVAQLVFAVVAPGKLVSNLVAGAVAEAGGMQAGELMQDFKTGHLVGASSRVQFLGQLAGCAASVLASVGAWRLFSAAYGVPSAELPAPVAYMWLDMARLLNGGELPDHCGGAVVCFALLGVALPLLRRRYGDAWVPSGVALGVGLTITPNLSVPRVLGALAHVHWRRRAPDSHARFMVIVASGLVLGDGIVSILTALLKTMGMGVWTCWGCGAGLCSGC